MASGADVMRCDLVIVRCGRLYWSQRHFRLNHVQRHCVFEGMNNDRYEKCAIEWA